MIHNLKKSDNTNKIKDKKVTFNEKTKILIFITYSGKSFYIASLLHNSKIQKAMIIERESAS